MYINGIKFIPNDFNYNNYKSLNKDLEGLNELECKTHYLIYGIKEFRQYKFNILIDFNQDLQHLNEYECIKHYLKFGNK
jgi:hypothetical protein